MRRTNRVSRTAALAALPLLAAGGLTVAGISPAMAAARVSHAAPAAFTTTAGVLAAVAATSATNAWAVGSVTAVHSGPLIMRWNGTSWAQVPLPRLRGSGGWLSAVAASSAHDAWAVGQIGAGTNLILHWNGSRWVQVRCPSPQHGDGLTGVTVTSNGAAWAVGFGYSSGGQVTEILRWSAGRWRLAARPVPLADGLGESGTMAAVAASSKRNAWAVGMGAAGFPMMTSHWNGKAWRQVAPPGIAGGILTGVATAPDGLAWAVGHTGSGPLILRWTGSVWRRVRRVAGPRNAILTGVTAQPDGTAWAVGSAGHRTLVLRWNGRAWRRVASADVTVAGAPDDYLSGVAAYSGGAWATGYTGGGGGFIMRWQGSQWR